MSSPASAHATRQTDPCINTGNIYSQSSSTSSFTFQCQETFSATAKILNCEMSAPNSQALTLHSDFGTFFPTCLSHTFPVNGPLGFLIFRSVSKRASAFFSLSQTVGQGGTCKQMKRKSCRDILAAAALSGPQRGQD